MIATVVMVVWHRRLAQQGNSQLVAILKTIDNDIMSQNFPSFLIAAVSIATEALIDWLILTAASHSRVMILEVMGRDAGHIAISAIHGEQM